MEKINTNIDKSRRLCYVYEHNKVKLGKIEKQILKLLLQGEKDPSGDIIIRGQPVYGYPPEGGSLRWLAKEIYGPDALERHDLAYYGSVVRTKPEVSISRALNNLFKKELVKVAVHPWKRERWRKPDEKGHGFYGTYVKDDKVVHATVKYWAQRAEQVELRNENTYTTELPHSVKKWWMLTDKGKDLIEEILGMKEQRREEILGIKEQHRREKIERCKRCTHRYKGGCEYEGKEEEEGTCNLFEDSY